MGERLRGFELVTRAKDNDDFKLPVRSTAGSAAYDFFSPVEMVIKPREKGKIETGVKVYMQQDEGLFIITRSGNGTKRRITLANNTALIDSDYYDNESNEGEIIIMLANEGDEDFEVKVGDKVAQGYFQKVLFADNDRSLAETRTGGLGSTGTR
ncbi:MAG: hypothetical protein ACQESE_04055 [Nanobdellota archaeon]